MRKSKPTIEENDKEPDKTNFQLSQDALYTTARFLVEMANDLIPLDFGKLKVLRDTLDNFYNLNEETGHIRTIQPAHNSRIFAYLFLIVPELTEKALVFANQIQAKNPSETAIAYVIKHMSLKDSQFILPLFENYSDVLPSETKEQNEYLILVQHFSETYKDKLTPYIKKDGK